MKLQPEILAQHVLNFTGSHRDDLLIGGGLGEDAALMRVPDGLLAAASDPVTGAEKGAGRLLVHINANDVACKGADPAWLVVTLIVPESLGIKFISETMREIHETCAEMDIAIAGGHTEITDKYPQPVLSATMLGLTRYNLSAKNIHAGDMVLATGHAGLEGMSIIAHDKPEVFRGIFSDAELETVRSWQNDLSVVRPAKILREYSHYMHDPTEGGLSGALLETSQACGLGLELFTDKIPIHPLTQKAAQALTFRPMNLISSGMLIAVISEGKISAAQAALSSQGISSVVIGKFVDGKGNTKLDAHEELPKISVRPLALAMGI